MKIFKNQIATVKENASLEEETDDKKPQIFAI